MLEDLIYDREQKDVVNKTKKGYYNYNDLNRIEEWCKYLASFFNTYNYPIIIQVKTDWTRNDFPTLQQINRIRNNVTLLKTTFFSYKNTPTINYKTTMNYTDANHIEKILKDLDVILTSFMQIFAYSGIANSDQSRIGLNKFRKEKIWTATPYKLSQFSETDKLKMIATNNNENLKETTPILKLYKFDKFDDVYASIKALNKNIENMDELIGCEVDYYIVKNLIDDASFENNQWNDTNNNNGYSTTEKLFGERSLYFATGTTLVPNIPVEQPIVGHTYYGRRYVKSYGDNQPADCRFEVYAGDGAGLNFVYGWNNGNFPEWTLCSEVLPVNDYFGTSTIIRCFNVNTTADYFIDGVMLIDLTECFGKGNEPTKEWCDTNIPFFIGTKTIKVRKE